MAKKKNSQDFTRQGVLNLDRIKINKPENYTEFLMCNHKWICDKKMDICCKCGAVDECIHD